MTRAGDRTVVEFERFRYEVMARSAQRGIDLFTLRLEPGAGPVRDPVSHAGEEAGMVVEGTMDVIVAGASYRLGPGDAIWFVSGQPHTFAAVGDEPCLSVWADTIPDHAEPGGARSVFDGLIAGTGAPGDARTMLAPAPAGAGADAALRSRRTARPIDATLPPARRRPPRRDRLLPARIPRHRHARGPGGRRLSSPAEMRDHGPAAGLAIEPVAVDGWRLLDGARVAVPGGDSDSECADDGRRPRRSRPARRARPRSSTSTTGERRLLDRLDVAGPHRAARLGEEPARPDRRDHGLELGLRSTVGMVAELPGKEPAVLPGRERARLVRLALVRVRPAVRDHVQGGRGRDPPSRPPRAEPGAGAP